MKWVKEENGKWVSAIPFPKWSGSVTYPVFSTSRGKASRTVETLARDCAAGILEEWIGEPWALDLAEELSSNPRFPPENGHPDNSAIYILAAVLSAGYLRRALLALGKYGRL